MNKELKIENRVEHDVVTSNLVYPIEKGYYCNAQLDDKWVKEKLWMWFQKRNLSIGNKYAVEVGANSGHKMLIYNHDGKHFLIQKDADA